MQIYIESAVSTSEDKKYRLLILRTGIGGNCGAEDRLGARTTSPN